MKQLSNVRKADKAHGDDLTLTRWVKEPGRHTKPSRTGLAPADAFVCPEQTNKTRCCATCGACWSTTKNVAFLEH